MKTILHSIFFLFSISAFGSDPRGDDIQIGATQAFTHEFRLPKGLRVRANLEKERVTKEGRFGYTRTNPDGIIVSLSIVDDQLLITGISISGGDNTYAVNPSMTSTNLIEKPVVATHFSGVLTAYYGTLICFHIREHAIEFTIKDGKVISQTRKRYAFPR